MSSAHAMRVRSREVGEGRQAEKGMSCSNGTTTLIGANCLGIEGYDAPSCPYAYQDGLTM